MGKQLIFFGPKTVSFETWITVNPFVFKMRISLIYSYLANIKSKFNPILCSKTIPRKLWWKVYALKGHKWSQRRQGAQIICSTLPETNSSHLQMGHPQKEIHLPILLEFSGAENVRIRESSFGLKSSAKTGDTSHLQVLSRTDGRSLWTWLDVINGFTKKNASVYREKWQEMRKVYTIYMYLTWKLLNCKKAVNFFPLICSRKKEQWIQKQIPCFFGDRPAADWRFFF